MTTQAKAEPVDRLVCADCGAVMGMVHPMPVFLHDVEWFQRLSQETLSAMTHHSMVTGHNTYARQEAIVLHIDEDEA